MSKNRNSNKKRNPKGNKVNDANLKTQIADEETKKVEEADQETLQDVAEKVDTKELPKSAEDEVDALISEGIENVVKGLDEEDNATEEVETKTVEDDNTTEEAEGEPAKETNPRRADFIARYIAGMATNISSQHAASKQISLQQELERELINAYKSRKWREELVDIFSRMTSPVFSGALILRQVHNRHRKRILSKQFETLAFATGVTVQYGIEAVGKKLDVEKMAKDITDPQIKARFIEFYSND